MHFIEDFYVWCTGIGPLALMTRDKLWIQNVASQIQAASWRLSPHFFTFCIDQNFHRCNKYVKKFEDRKIDLGF